MPVSEFSCISTPRLRLVPVSDACPEEVADLIGNYDVARWLGRVPYPYNPDDARAFIAANRSLSGRVWFIRMKGELIGGISIDRELGYWLARDEWGRGYATEAAEAVIDVHFADPQAEALVSGHYPGNDRSARVLRSLGFVYTGRRPVRAMALAQTVEGHEMCLTRSEWNLRNFIEIETERLVMRPLRDADWRLLQRFGGVPEVARMMLSLTVPWPEEAVRTWILSSRFRGRLGYRLGISLRGGPLIGAIGVGSNRSIHYMLDHRYWHRGYMSEALEAFVQDVFDRFSDLDRLEADHFTDNPASGAVLRKIGFERVGTGLGASSARVERVPNVIYRLHRSAFGARR